MLILCIRSILSLFLINSGANFVELKKPQLTYII